MNNRVELNITEEAAEGLISEKSMGAALELVGCKLRPEQYLRDASADAKARIAKFIEITFMQPFLPAFKCMVADRTGDAEWRHVRPPLVPLTGPEHKTLRETLDRAGFERNGQ